MRTIVPMKVVADTNTFLAVALDEPEKQEIIALTNGQELIAPAVLPFEIGNALSALVKRNKLSEAEARAAWRACQKIPVDLREIDIEMALNIATEHNISAYDAYFIVCAINLRSPLLTLDRQLKSVALAHGLKVMGC